mgnify:CR=1 FL=1
MKTVIVDSDALIALSLSSDQNHNRAVKISENWSERGYTFIFPNTMILEAMTSLKRAKNEPKIAHLINKQFLSKDAFNVLYVDEEIQIKAGKLFDKADSKKNTPFDTVVAASAETIGADAIFSFDSWYPKLGFELAEVPEE